MILELQKIPETILWTVLGIILLYGSVWVYDRLDPINYREAIRQGNIAAGLVVASVILAMGGIIVCILAT
ncbi:DUF350 domain-containing protein [filamentous cyanobacterium LEGE 11480]|uniref:DUF350 domain-containing protein n=1 Tax=Romeriopsis navalis LEGE 11480 TaxID=2777977 RepID=A0A928VVC2_9CYAN|nr:DUF350 domain-containing protein [Romeriopsis navalis]MBE9033265.1 DUF350 domain-containing protein [Romeriopsis navalis LEGE 11480]